MGAESQAEPTTAVRRLASRLPLVAALVAFFVYLPRLCPTVAMLGDSPVFAAAAIEWGVPQPPGYPLVTAIGHLFAQIPFGDPAWRVHLTSAVYHAATVGVIAATTQRMTRSWLAALSAGLMLAFSRVFYLGSLYAEAFPLNDLFTALVLGLAIDIAAGEASENGEPHPLRRIAAFATLAGIASTHHQMIALLAPAVAILLGPTLKRVLGARRVHALLLVAAFTVPFAAIYSLVLLAAARHPFVSWGDVNDAASLVRLVTRTDYGGLFSPALVTGDEGPFARVLLFGSSTLDAWSVVGVVLAVAGAIDLWRSSRRLAVALLAAFVVSGPFFAAINALHVGDPAARAFAERFFTMAHVVLALLVGGGIAAAERLVRARRTDRAPALAGLAAVWLLPLVAHSSSANLSRDRVGAAFVHDLVAHVEPDAIVLVAGDHFVGAAAYACAVEHACERRPVFSPGQLHLSWKAAQLRRRYPDVALGILDVEAILHENLARRPMYVAKPLLDRVPRLADLHGYLPTAILLRVTTEADVRGAETEFRASTRRMLTPSGCRGCAALVLHGSPTPLEAPVAAIYVDALANHERIARLIFAAEPEALALQARRRAIDARTERGW